MAELGRLPSKRYKPPAAVGYVRVSSASQDGAMQRNAIRNAMAARGDALTLPWYEEKRSAKTTARPVLAQLRADVRAGKVKRVYVWRLDRLVRSGIRDALTLIDEFRAAGCELVTVADGFDPCGPAAEVVIAVLAWAAKMEWHAITERRHAARERIQAEGGSWGRPRKMTDAQRATLARHVAAGKSVRAISQHMGIARATVAREIARLKSTAQNGAPPTPKKRASRRTTLPPSH